MASGERRRREPGQGQRPDGRVALGRDHERVLGPGALRELPRQSAVHGLYLPRDLVDVLLHGPRRQRLGDLALRAGPPVPEGGDPLGLAGFRSTSEESHALPHRSFRRPAVVAGRAILGRRPGQSRGPRYGSRTRTMVGEETPWGMHHGIVAAEATAERLIATLDALSPSLTPGSRRGVLDELDLEHGDDGFRLAFGERDGRAYILDASMVLGLMATRSSRHRARSARSSSAAANTTSGSGSRLAADRGQLIRAYWNCDLRTCASRGRRVSPWRSRPTSSRTSTGPACSPP